MPGEREPFSIGTFVPSFSSNLWESNDSRLESGGTCGGGQVTGGDFGDGTDLSSMISVKNLNSDDGVGADQSASVSGLDTTSVSIVYTCRVCGHAEPSPAALLEHLDTFHSEQERTWHSMLGKVALYRDPEEPGVSVSVGAATLSPPSGVVWPEPHVPEVRLVHGGRMWFKTPAIIGGQAEREGVLEVDFAGVTGFIPLPPGRAEQAIMTVELWSRSIDRGNDIKFSSVKVGLGDLQRGISTHVEARLNCLETAVASADAASASTNPFLQPARSAVATGDFGKLQLTLTKGVCAAEDNDRRLWPAQPSGVSRSLSNRFRGNRAGRKAREEESKLEALVGILAKLIVHRPPKAKELKVYEQSVVNWIPDALAPKCPDCGGNFSVSKRRHHCRLCGGVVCKQCSAVICSNEAIKIVRAVRNAKIITGNVAGAEPVLPCDKPFEVPCLFVVHCAILVLA